MKSPKYVYEKIKGSIAGTDRDAATVNLGKQYRMPTIAQFQELIDECKWQWTSLNGVNGMKITGPNGNSIFLPAAGIRWGDGDAGEIGDVGSSGSYLSASSLNEYGSSRLNFFSGYWLCNFSGRAYGQSVRPVANKNMQ